MLVVDAQVGVRPARMWRYLPLAIFTTGSVVVAPVVIVAAVIRGGGPPSIAISALATVAVSVAIAGIEASLWTRLCRSQDLTFAELMLWGWLRRCWAERGLAERRDLYESAQRITPAVSLDQLERLSRMLEARDSYTYGHSRRVARHAARIARRMHLPDEEVAKIRTAAVVHDVGKIYTPREILNNPDRLTDAEFEIIKRHAADGARMLATVGNPDIAAMVRHHHERIDGSGYPDGLAGEDIPIGARIIAVADTFDALTSNRAYQDASTHRRALSIISREAGSRLDRTAAAAFLSRYSSRRSIASFSLAAMLPQRLLAALQSVSTNLGVSASGATSILPALGAAGLFALSSAPGHRALTSGRSVGHRDRALAQGLGDVAPSAHVQLTRQRSQLGTTGEGGRTPRRDQSKRPSSEGLPGSALRQPPASTAPGSRAAKADEGAPTIAQTPASSPAQMSSGSSLPAITVPGEAPGLPPQPLSGATPSSVASSLQSVSSLATNATQTPLDTTTATLAGTAGTVSSTATALLSRG